MGVCTQVWQGECVRTPVSVEHTRLEARPVHRECARAHE